MKRTHDKYGRGSAAANGIGFVDLEPGDTFDGLVLDGDRKLATITLKQNQGQHNIYSVEALEINKDAESERTPRGAISEDLNSAPLQNLASQLANKITYYVGDVKRTQPSSEIPNGAGGRSFVASSRSIWNVDLAVFRSRHHLQKKLRAPHVPAESPDAA